MVGQRVKMLLGHKGSLHFTLTQKKRGQISPQVGRSSEPCQLQSPGHLRCASAEISNVLGVPQTESGVAWPQFWSLSGRKWKCNAYLCSFPPPETLTGLYLRCSSHASPDPPQIPQNTLRIPFILHPGPPAAYQPFHVMTIWLRPPGRVELLP